MARQGDLKQNQKNRKRKLQWFERQKSSSKLKAELLKKQAAERKKRAEQAQGNAQSNEAAKVKEAAAKLKQLKENKAEKESKGKKKKVYADVSFLSFSSVSFLLNSAMKLLCFFSLIKTLRIFAVDSHNMALLFFTLILLPFHTHFSPLKMQKDLQLKLIESVNEVIDSKKAHVAEIEVCHFRFYITILQISLPSFVLYSRYY